MMPPFRGRGRGRAAALALLFALGACQAPGEAMNDNPQDAAETAGLGDALSGDAAAVDSGDSAPPPSIALQPAPPIDDDPGQLLGLDPDALEGRLGPPDLLRREAPAEVWQYRGSACVLDLFLYEKEGGKQVVYLEARDFEAAEVESRSCLRGLLTARRDAATS